MYTQSQEIEYKGYRIIQYSPDITSFILRNKVQISKGEERSPLYAAPHWLSVEELIEYAENYFREKCLQRA